MHYTQVSDIMRQRAECLLAGRLDEMLAGYAFPIPVELQSTRVVVRSADEGRAMLQIWHAALVQSGVVAMEAKVIALDAPRRGRFRVWVEYHEIVPGEDKDRLTLVQYYCSTTANGFRIEMVCYPQMSMPELNPKFAALALSA